MDQLPRTLQSRMRNHSDWTMLVFVLPLGWKETTAAETSGSDLPSGPTSTDLIISSFEVVAPYARPARNDPFENPLSYAVTVYFGDGFRAHEPVNGKPEFKHLSVDGSDLRDQHIAGDRGQRFHDRDLRELSRRTGLRLEQLREAYGKLKNYRLLGGMLQYSCYSRSKCQFE